MHWATFKAKQKATYLLWFDRRLKKNGKRQYISGRGILWSRNLSLCLLGFLLTMSIIWKPLLILTIHRNRNFQPWIRSFQLLMSPINDVFSLYRTSWTTKSVFAAESELRAKRKTHFYIYQSSPVFSQPFLLNLSEISRFSLYSIFQFL